MSGIVIPAVERLSERVIRILGQNPGKMTLWGTNTYLVGTKQNRILVDTGEGKTEYRDLLKGVLKEQQCKIDTVILTHWHPDHVGGIDDVRAANGEDSEVRVLKLDDPVRKVQGVSSFLSDGERVETEGAALKIIHTPGHTNDHASLLLEQENAIFTGDCILGASSAVFSDLATYMRSLEHLQSFSPSRLYPGHGPCLEDGSKAIADYIDHRLQREEQIMSLLQHSTGSTGSDGLTAMEIVRVIYEDKPESLYPAAAGNVLHHLAKLQGEGRVVRNVVEDDVWPPASGEGKPPEELKEEEEEEEGSTVALLKREAKTKWSRA